MKTSSAAALVGAGALTVLVFPLTSSILSKRIKHSVDADSASATA